MKPLGISRFMLWSFGLSLLLGCAGTSGISKSGARFQRIRFLTSDQGMVYADVYGLEGPRKFGVVLAHDSHSGKEDWSPLINPLLMDGAVIMAIDFRGYGKSVKGSLGENRLDFDVLAACYYLKREMNIKPVSVIGSGMGGLAALIAASTRYIIDSLILISPQANFNSVKNIQCPILYIVSKHDETYRSSLAMHDRNPAKSKFREVPGIATGQYLLDGPDALQVVALIRSFYYDQGQSLYFPGIIYE